MLPNPQKTADLVTHIEEIRNGKPHFLCVVLTAWRDHSQKKRKN